MAGMNAKTGHTLDGIAHIQQSITDIITTPIGSRVMRRNYGSLVPELLDMPTNETLLLQVYAATILAVSRWEPRIKITGARRHLSTANHGRATMELYGETTDGQPVVVGVPLT